MGDDELYRRADEKISFYRHLYSFVAVNIMFIVMNVVFSPGEWWFYWITCFLGNRSDNSLCKSVHFC